jgi:hypothetical protein
LRSITREAILFGTQNETLAVTESGGIAVGARRQAATERRTGLFTDEARDCVNRAGFLAVVCRRRHDADDRCHLGGYPVSLQISKLILYSRTGQVREVVFRTGQLNVLTGASKTGKSAIIDIIDYCTGRSECNVAEGVIRRYVGWYAILFQLNGGQILIARRNPPVGERTSGDVYMDRGSAMDTPVDGGGPGYHFGGIRVDHAAISRKRRWCSQRHCLTCRRAPHRPSPQRSRVDHFCGAVPMSYDHEPTGFKRRHQERRRWSNNRAAHGGEKEDSDFGTRAHL